MGKNLEKQVFITVGREFGSAGHIIGEKLAERLGIHFYDRKIMDELGKINRVIDREYPDAYRETLVVLDGTTGQNALQQAKEFNEASEIDGIVLTKLDGSAKGGIVIAIQSEMKIPVKYVGVGESIDDLQRFDSDSFVKALFDEEDGE